MLANATSTTRRGFFGAVAAITAGAGLSASAQSPAPSPQRTFIDCIGGIHDDGRRVATEAMQAGWHPSECYSIMLNNGVLALLFKRGRRYETLFSDRPSDTNPTRGAN